MTGNLGYKIDMWLMGPNHMYHGEGVAFDPEGWLSTLPSVVNVTFGFIVGKFIQEKGKSFEGLAKLLLVGFALIVIGYFWDLSFPINKKLWTSSFVVYTVGLDCVILAAIIYVVDFLGRTKWTNFFTVFGKNPLFIYFCRKSALLFYILFRSEPGVSVLHGFISIFTGMLDSILVHCYSPYPGCYFAG